MESITFFLMTVYILLLLGMTFDQHFASMITTNKKKQTIYCVTTVIFLQISYSSCQAIGMHHVHQWVIVVYML